jgi:DNA repair protein RecN (Recombination protein N)
VITSLYIKDFALIDELETTFSPGLNIMTGETGAGKSIIIGALNVLLGERAQTESIRQGAKKAVAEVILQLGDDTKLKTLLDENGIEQEVEIILRREIRQTGSRAFVNDTPVQLAVLKKIGERLVDLHGQHDHQLLLKTDHHREVLDGRGKIPKLLEDYQAAFEDLAALRAEKKQLKRRQAELLEKQDLYRYQLKELRNADIRPGEAEQLEKEIRLLDSSEFLNETAARVLQAGRDAEYNALDLIRIMQESLREIVRMEDEFEWYEKELSTARISIEELLRFTEQYQNNIEFNPEHLEHLRQRQAELRRLEKKYGKSAEELLQLQEELAQALSLGENFDYELEKLDAKLKKATDRLAKKADQLHEGRLREGRRLSGYIEEELLRLGFSHAAFEVEVNWRREGQSSGFKREGAPVSCQPDGADEVSFYISTNKGEQPKPLSRTASGGEMSRIMLALKSILAREQRLPVMIFDEIDTGISGPIALQVGRTMRELAENCQIICITHLPQIASMGHHHVVVRKVESDKRTVTKIETLDPEEHVREVAKLMSGSEITEAALHGARELIESGRTRRT